ncbi:MAG TPA: DNA methyltransferase [Terriglobales bacterium]|nr:DNA methyltransferase [Terriglobales bacterium]
MRRQEPPDSILTLPINKVVFVKALYPRLREDDGNIERLRAAVDLLPPIVVARGHVLVDGFHRWQAFRREGRPSIPAIDLGNLTDAEIFKESIRRNAEHGLQLSLRDKEHLTVKLWQTYAHLRNAERIAQIAKLLAVSTKSIERWTKDIRAREKEALKERAWDMWLDGATEQEIADEVQVHQTTVGEWLKDSRQKSEKLEPPESRQHFDVWQFATPDDDAGTPSFFGKLAPQVIENLIWLYTEPGQIVVDPFAGGGTVIDVAKRMGRRVWASDRCPATPTLPIHEHDITTGWHKSAPPKADFILLDPPYWMQAADRYSSDPADLGNMSLDDFLAAWRKTIKTCADHLAPEGHLAFIVSPAEDTEGDRVVDLAMRMYQVCEDQGLQCRRRIIALYNGHQQATGQQVIWARENKKLLKLYRDIIVLRRED